MAYCLPKVKNKPEQSGLCSDVVEIGGLEPLACYMRSNRSTN